MAGGEVLLSKLNIFDTEETLLSVEDHFYEVVNSSSALDGGTPSQLYFVVPPDNLAYTDLNHTYLMLDCSYQKKDGGDLPDAAKIGPVNAPGSSIFKSCDIHINDQKITSFEVDYAYVGYFNSLCHLNSAKRSYLQLGLYQEDTFDKLETVNASDPFPGGATPPPLNEGLKKRAEYFSKSKKVTLLSKIYSPPHNITKLLINKLKIEYLFTLNDMAFYTMAFETDPQEKYKFVIHKAALYVKRVVPSQSLLIAHEKLLSDRNARYHMKFFTCKSYNIPTGSFSFIWENLMLNSTCQPSVIYVLFVRAMSRQGNFKANPFSFQLFDLAQLECYLGHKQIPNLGVAMRDTKHITEPLWLTYQAMNYLGSNFGPEVLNRDSFSNGCAIFSFDLTRDGNPAATYHNTSFNPHLRLEGKFRTATTESIVVLALGLSLGTLEINKFRQPFVNY